MPVRNSRIVEVRYASTDPLFAAAAANALAKAYIQQNMEYQVHDSKDAADWLSRRLAEQRRALEASEAALQAYKEKNGTVSVADSASNIVVQRLTDLNGALTKAKTERINKEALYNQLKAAEGSGALDTYPAVISNEYIQKLKADLADLQRQQATLAQTLRRAPPRDDQDRAARSRRPTPSCEASSRKVVESVKNEYQAALSEERSLQSALDAQKSEALSLNRKGIEYGVLTARSREQQADLREPDAAHQGNRHLERAARQQHPRRRSGRGAAQTPISPNLQRDLLVSFGGSLVLALGLAFFFEHLDNRIRTPQEMKAHIAIPVPRHGAGRRRKNSTRSGEPAAEQRRPRRASSKRSRRCGPTCCSRRRRTA